LALRSPKKATGIERGQPLKLNGPYALF